VEEIQKFFKCPYCFEKISILIDVSTESQHTYVEDCEVCYNPIQVESLGRINPLSPKVDTPPLLLLTLEVRPEPWTAFS